MSKHDPVRQVSIPLRVLEVLGRDGEDAYEVVRRLAERAAERKK